jgi:hypothetical protein
LGYLNIALLGRFENLITAERLAEIVHWGTEAYLDHEIYEGTVLLFHWRFWLKPGEKKRLPLTLSCGGI